MRFRIAIVALLTLTLGVWALPRLLAQPEPAAAQPPRPAPSPAADPPPPASAAGAAPEATAPETEAPAATADNGWPDRRPISVVMQSGHWLCKPNNPRGWNGAWATNPEAAHADSVKRSVKLGAQAILYWDPEGQEHDHPISYLGTPWALPPERSYERMRRWSAACRDAGLLCGGTVRPQVFDPGPPAKQTRTLDYFGTLAGKVGFARAAFGWRIFYVDTNAAADYPEKNPDRFIKADVFRRLTEAFPDCLFLPEFSGTGYENLPRVAPMSDRGDYAHRPRHPFVTLNPDNRPAPEQDRAEWARLIKAGGIPLVCATWDSPENAWVMEAYRKATKGE